MNWNKKILHLGLGRFHRGHQAIYYQKMKELGDARWGVISMSMRSPDARDQLRAVNLRYPVLELSAQDAKTTWVESIREALNMQQDLKRVLEVFQDKELEIVTLTITEKGYDLDASGKLDLTRAHIAKDLQTPDSPQSAIGLLALGLRHRRLAGQNAVTVISCDNLRDNGHKLRSAVESYLSHLAWNDDLLWVKQEITFPNTMVDRIVPSLLPEKISSLEIENKLPPHSELIGTEKFSQWVIEDCFAQTRPDWDKAGVQFVSKVRPFEEMKLKLLNAAHSYLAYAGLNRGHQFVHEAIEDAELRKNVLELFSEVTPLLEVPEKFNLAVYQNDLIERFGNNKLPHQLKQIAMDGSQKLPQRIFPSLMETEEKNLKNDALVSALKEWIRFAHSQTSLEDPEAKTLKDIFQAENWQAKLWSGKLFSPLSLHNHLRGKILF